MRGKWLCLLALLPATRIDACTMCYSDTALQARSLIFADAFSFNLAVSVLPFLAVAAVAVAVYRGGARR